MPEQEPTIHVGLSWKKQVRQFEMVEVSVGVAGITPAMSPDEIAGLIDGPGKIAYDLLVQSLTDKMADAIVNAENN